MSWLHPRTVGQPRRSRRFHSLSSGSRLRTRSVSSTATCRTRPIPTASSRSLLPTGPSWRPGVGQRPRMRYQSCLNGCFLHRPARPTNRAMTSPCWTTSSCWALRRSRRRSPHDSRRHSQRWSHRWTGRRCLGHYAGRADRRFPLAEEVDPTDHRVTGRSLARSRRSLDRSRRPAIAPLLSRWRGNAPRILLRVRGAQTGAVATTA